MIACITTLLAALVLAQKPNISLVKGAPTNYGAYGFDISWVEPSTEKYYLTDRPNNAIELRRWYDGHVHRIHREGPVYGKQPLPRPSERHALWQPALCLIFFPPSKYLGKKRALFVG